ncbi:hypothetical protein GZH46_00879, partial [Fragariocoptes setiger]
SHSHLGIKDNVPVLSIACVAMCVAVASAQYQASGYQQRKMAPMPAYGQSSGYGAAQSTANEYEASGSSGYGGASKQYRAPSSAMTSQYDERTPAASGYSSAPASAGYRAAAPTSSYQGKTSGYGGAAAPATSSYGQTNSYSAKPKYEEPYHPPMPFAWGYDINDGYGGAQYHKENGDEYGKRTGSYGYTDAYGVYRQVDYVADEYGFRATVKTNEPGTANEAPADVEWHAYEPPSKFYAGNTDSYSSGSSQYSGASSGSSYGANGGSQYSSSAAPAA